MEQQIQHTDILIIGGGPSGASAALSLANHTNYEITLIEQSDFSNTRIGEHVSASIFDLIEYLQLSKSDFEKDCFIPSYASKAYWGSSSVSTTNSIFTTAESTYQMNRESFDFKLIETAAERGVTIFPRTKCMSYDQLEDKNWMVTINHPEKGKFTLLTKYLVDATGRSGHVCRKVGAYSKKNDALVGVGLFFERSISSRKFEQTIEAVEQGWWYAACLPHNKMVITFFSDADIISEGKLHGSEVWNDLLRKTAHIKHLIQEARALSDKPWVRNAQTQMSDTLHLERFIAIGDAALSFDPISSMGIGFSISSACFAARHIAQELTHNVSSTALFQKDLLKNYQQYDSIKNQFYQKEKRWPASVFWKRRN